MGVDYPLFGYLDPVSSAEDLAAEYTRPDMPAELQDAVNRVLDEPARARAAEKWAELREHDRRMCWNYINARAFSRWRRKRAEKAARMLSAGLRPPRRVRVPRVIRGAADIAAGGL